MVLRVIISAFIGGGLGFAWYKLVGCSTGACPLTRHPLITVAYGMIVGVLFAFSFR